MKEVRIKTISSVIFLVVLALLFAGVDKYARLTNPIGYSTLFPRNDHEITVARHGSSNFDKVFFGSSPVVSAFRGDDSVSGFVEMGIVLGRITCILAMLEREIIKINEELVLGLSIAVFADRIHTDPTYIWHLKPHEPYVFFYRDRLNSFLTKTITNFLNGNFQLERYYDLEKWLYFGTLSDERLHEMLVDAKNRFWIKELSDFHDNLTALNKLIEFCFENNIRLRAVWMPVNPDVPTPQIYEEVFAEANYILSSNNIETKDMINVFPREYFYDIGHMNYELGAVAFTQEIDLWLKRRL